MIYCRLKKELDKLVEKAFPENNLYKSDGPLRKVKALSKHWLGVRSNPADSSGRGITGSTPEVSNQRSARRHSKDRGDEVTPEQNRDRPRPTNRHYFYSLNLSILCPPSSHVNISAYPPSSTWILYGQAP